VSKRFELETPFFSFRIDKLMISKGGKLRIRPVSGGYNKNWNVQFPSNIREAGLFFYPPSYTINDYESHFMSTLGAKYVVEELLEAANGGYYRAKVDSLYKE